MRIKRWMETTSAILLAGLWLQADAQAMDVRDALANAYTHNPQLESAREAVRVADEDVSRALSGWRPTISAGYTRDHEGVSVNNGPRTDTWAHSKSLNLQQPIFNGGETVAATKRARKLVEQQRAVLTDTEQQVLLDSAIAFVDVVRTRQVLDLARKNEEVLRKHRQATMDRFEVGEVTRTDTAQSDARLARAESERVQAEGEVTIAEATFERITRLPPPEQADLPSLEVWEPKNLDEVLTLAQEFNPQLLQAIYNAEAADANISQQTARLLPTVTLNGSLREETGLLFLNNKGTVENDVITVNVNVPLYQAGDEYASVRRAKKQYHQAKQDRQNVNNSVVELVTHRWKQLEVSRTTIEANEQAIRAARIALDGVKQEYDYGARTTLDVLDAEQEQFEAEVNLITAQRNALVAQYNLAALAGKFTAQALKLNVTHYDPKVHYDNTEYKILGF